MSWIGTTCYGLRLPVKDWDDRDMDWDDLAWVGTTRIMDWDDLCHELGRPVSWIGKTCVIDWDDLFHGLGRPVSRSGKTYVMDWDDLCPARETICQFALLTNLAVAL